MDDPNITMEEYIRLEEEKARRHGKVYNWETATYGKIWDNEDVHDLRSIETEFPAIVFTDTLTSEAAFSCEPTVSSLNNDEINFRISFDESDDEDCMVSIWRIMGNGYGVSTSCTILVLYKVEDIATCLVEYVKFWDDWEVDRYGNANLDYYSEDQYAVSIKEDTAYSCLHSLKTIENKAQYAVSKESQYAIFKIWNKYNILEDIKRGPYFKKSPIRRIQLLGYAISSRIFHEPPVDTAYESSWIRHIGLYIFMVACEVQAQIRRIFLDGYGVLDVKTTDSWFLRLSSKMCAF
ncbi:hypothetical protein Tco_0389990 [Tanacetum coccineum]